jgi:hypothetical protein
MRRRWIKKMSERIEAALTATAFAEEGDAEAARRIAAPCAPAEAPPQPSPR